MSQTYFALLTAVGEAKLANAVALGTTLQVSRMAVGDGNGVLPVPVRTQTALVKETYRADLNSLVVDPLNASQIIAELVIPESEGGYWLREMGLYDDAGDLIAVANCPPSYKPVVAEGSGKTQVMRMVLIVSSTAAVQLKIDPSVVLATRSYVDSKIVEELSKQDFKFSALVASVSPLVLSGAQTVDDVALVAGDRVLVKNQATAKDNGLYIVAAGVWPRALDADVSTEVTPGMFVHIEKGTTNGDSVWQLVTDAPITLNTTALVFEMAVGRTGVSAGSYTGVTVDKYGRVIAATNSPALPALSRVTALNATAAIGASQMGLLLLDASAGDRTFTLPAADASLGVVDAIVRRVDNTTNRLIIQAAGTNKIKFHTHLNNAGYSFLYLMGAGDWWHLRSDGAGNWWPIGRLDTTPLGRPVFETTTIFHPGGNGPMGGVIYTRSEWPWLWDHAQASGMLTTEALRVGFEGNWTTGDGASTFRGPDGRGEFLRVWDDGRNLGAISFAANVTSGSKVLAGVVFTGTPLAVGMPISGTGIPASSTITALDRAAGTLTISANATATTANVVCTASGRVPGSRQNGTIHYADLDGVSGYGLTSGPAPIQPRISKDDIGFDPINAADYPVDVGVSGSGPGAATIALSATPQYFGVARPRNIAFPGRIKLI